MKTRLLWILPSLAIFLLSFAYTALVDTTLNDFFLPGSQPGQSGQLETPDKCDNCHGGYDTAVEPAFNWRGSMMAQAARDPFFYACMTVANQDAEFAGDLCIRCHSPAGWLEGRSIPTDGSALNANDREGVQCDFCHKLVKPTEIGVNPYPTDGAYTTSGTYDQDQSYLATLSQIPPTSGNGMYIADANNAKRGPFTDAAARHKMYYSPLHKEAALCGTCHDVSNPAYVKNDEGNGNYFYTLNDLDAPSPSFDPYSMFPVERTYSEWMNSAFNTPGGVYAPRFGGNKDYVSTCQDCHMRDVTGAGCNKRGVAVRDDLPLHDMTGGNTWVPDIIPIFFPGETDPAALSAGKERAATMLQRASTLEVSGSIPSINVRVINETGHKLPSGYPEGRRIWLNVRCYDAGDQLIGEFGAYDYNSATLTKTDTKVYEIKLGMSPEIETASGLANLADGSSFHFVLNNRVIKDNRIPPRGFTNDAFRGIQSPPVGYSYADGEHWDDTPFTLPTGTSYYEVNLYYQTTSKDYVEFLRDENRTNDYGTLLHDAWTSSGKSAPVLMATYSSRGPVADTEAPTTPSGLTAEAPKFNLVNLSWSPSTDNVGVVGYYVYRTDIGTTPIATVSTTTYSDGGVVQSTTYSYSVRAFDEAGNSSGLSSTVTVTTPGKGGGKRPMSLMTDHGNSISGLNPNPFNPTTTLSYQVAVLSEVTVDVVNTSGRIVRRLNPVIRNAGEHRERIDASGLASGIYFIRLTMVPLDAQQKASLVITKGILLK